MAPGSTALARVLALGVDLDTPIQPGEWFRNACFSMTGCGDCAGHVVAPSLVFAWAYRPSAVRT
jgi:hypothetical protein